MEDSDDIRRFIELRLIEEGLDRNAVSLLIGRNKGYLHDYLKKRSPKVMPTETKLLLAKELKCPPSRLGVVAMPLRDPAGGFYEDAEPYHAGPQFPRLPGNVFPYVIKSDCLSLHPLNLKPGVVLAIDGNMTDPQKIPLGRIVLGHMAEREMPQRMLGTVVRQFIPPDKLITNRAGLNEILSLDDPSLPYHIVLRGAAAWIMQDLTSGEFPEPLVVGNVPLVLPS